MNAHQHDWCDNSDAGAGLDPMIIQLCATVHNFRNTRSRRVSLTTYPLLHYSSNPLLQYLAHRHFIHDRNTYHKLIIGELCHAISFATPNVTPMGVYLIQTPVGVWEGTFPSVIWERYIPMVRCTACNTSTSISQAPHQEPLYSLSKFDDVHLNQISITAAF